MGFATELRPTIWVSVVPGSTAPSNTGLEKLNGAGLALEVPRFLRRRRFRKMATTTKATRPPTAPMAAMALVASEDEDAGISMQVLL